MSMKKTAAVEDKKISLDKESYIKSVQERIAKIPISNYRNFSIVAHVDHGKSTLSDRLLELTGVIQPGDANKQVLDKLDVERERGITVKAQTCSMFYVDPKSKEEYLLHLVDTPGHVDFRAEVSRSYASCGGALLLIDASQGVQAQTVANFYLAYSMGLKLIPVINKIDLDAADIPRAMDQVETTFELPREDCIPVSAKTGLNIENIIPAIIRDIPGPRGSVDKPLKALLVDSWHDPYVGVVMLIHVVDGVVKKGMKLLSAHSEKRYDVKEVGIMYPDKMPMDCVKAGQVAYIIPGMRNPREAMIGDTFYQYGKHEGLEPLPGFEEPKPMVFVGAFPADGGEFKVMNDHMENLVLNDRSVTLEKETSNALGLGWRLGFLGSLHASVFKERLENEYGAKIILTAPTVPYKLIFKDGEESIVTNPDEFPGADFRNHNIEMLMEPYVNALMTIPDEYIGTVMSLCENNRGIQKELEYLTTGQVLLKYEIPLAQLVEDFFGKLKGCTKGYASLDYEDAGYKKSDIVKMELCVNGEPQDALTQVMHRSQVLSRGKEYVTRFKEYLKFQLFEVAIQAKVNNKVVARETIKAKRKDVTQKLHAADISRRKKLLSRQKEGKKQMKATGKISINQEAYQAFLRRAD
ncbi:DEHA2F02222p [Debaryomyces hansenii CBS767]|uniref:Translation factor GUF1, mitochondrial n=1 Tax=Debaryomyces hansenii (strain ATCC 36239 / CBS 767 / BCRC 21394 / JCM 1990 / NBRC 0083 / IGC 2968) TaxID=284592 RepID=GUF1_DEBHA|nr:DEHA2F02222p [Debaryomyces hansenii CBS767]Q6BMV8.2 RecName: Full=Translation factor GUF1, mitochondrial; AltName: Full=Elongation factor 4 homolog; Short=EF-4; AltName: Full=GTPase GUF1; AltName: Full=Ribosomal back-translocase [Debaryomyces hansenii CBS767]CAG88769.2 DEHA2F02222p [Debaryomyces hansenii CBS767]|eukprot:XP_460462.2 DEHA2F02222p [Debaryomyces hansenii CBS767]